jgi:hypothetical protein
MEWVEIGLFENWTKVTNRELTNALLFVALGISLQVWLIGKK